MAEIWQFDIFEMRGRSSVGRSLVAMVINISNRKKFSLSHC